MDITNDNTNIDANVIVDDDVNNPWSYLLADKKVQAYFLVVLCSILKCAHGYYCHHSSASPSTTKEANVNDTKKDNAMRSSLSSLPPLLSMLIIGITWFYILRFIITYQFTSESYFDDAYKDVLYNNNLYFTSTQLLTWAVVSVIWTADEGAHIGYLLFGFLGAMSAAFVLWVVPSSSSSSSKQHSGGKNCDLKRGKVSILYVISSMAAFYCILYLRPCIGTSEQHNTNNNNNEQFCSKDVGFGSYLPNFRYYLHGLHILLLLPVIITKLLLQPLNQKLPTIHTAILYAFATVVFAYWHVYQMVKYKAVFHVPRTDCQKSITIDLICCSGITLYAIYRDYLGIHHENDVVKTMHIRNPTEEAQKWTLIALCMMPIISPAAVLSAHLCSFRFKDLHMEVISFLQCYVAEKRRSSEASQCKSEEKTQTSNKKWCNLGLWKNNDNNNKKDNDDENTQMISYNEACESLALALAKSANLSNKTDAVLCCGCGSSAQELSLYNDTFNLKHITGIDPAIDKEEDARAIDYGAHLLYEQDFNIRKMKASVEELNSDHHRHLFPPNVFSTILALDNVYHYTNKLQFFKDCFEMLPLAAATVVADGGAADGGGTVAVTDIILNNSAVPMWVIGTLYAMGVFNVWTEDEYRKHLTSTIGFAEVTVERIGDDVFRGWKHLLPSALLKHIDYAIIVGRKKSTKSSVAVLANTTEEEKKENGDVNSAYNKRPKKKVAIIGSGMAGLSAAHTINSSLRAADVSVDIYEANSRPGLAGATTLLGEQLIDVPPRMATMGYYKNYVQLLHKLRVPLAVVKSDCTYCIEDGCGRSTLYTYEKSDFANLFNALFVGGPRNLWKVMKAMSEVHDKWSGDPSTTNDNKECDVSASFGAWLHKHFHLYRRTSQSESLRQNSNRDKNETNKDTTFDMASLVSHENPFLSVMIGSLGWMLSCTYNELFRCPADIMLSYIKGLRNSQGFLGLFNNDGEVARVIPSIKTLENALLYGVNDLCLDTPVRGVDEKKVINGVQYDAVICATEASAVNKVIKDGSPVFDSFKYHPSIIYLHNDETFMPSKRNSWRTWGVFMAPNHDEPQLTFWLNQFYPDATFEGNVFQTWAPVRTPKSDKIIKKSEFTRVLHTEESRDLVATVDAEQGKRGIYYAGSYSVYGMGLLEQALVSGRNAGEQVIEDLFGNST